MRRYEPCRTCGGNGFVEAEICWDTRADGKSCRQLARIVTDPRFLEVYAPADPEAFPPNFMHFCARHGNARKRQWNWQQRRKRERAKMKESAAPLE